jgi:hypothetical protein
MSAPARNKVSIISREDEAGPSVATCFVDLRQRCANFGTDATVVSWEVSVVGILGAIVDFKDVDELDIRTTLLVGAKAEQLTARAATTQEVENFMFISCCYEKSEKSCTKLMLQQL